MDVGVTINQYNVVEHIGRGGMADVWSARDERLGRMVAIKTIAQTLSQDDDPVGMFKTEAQTIAQMEHPHILPIYDFGEYEGQLYIVMRYVSGGSLEDLLRSGPLPLKEALRLGRNIAEALDYAHVNNVIHLDLKPPNVLLDSHQSPYLADFGLATVLENGKAVNPGSGTLLYMAPEQLTSEVIDHRADIYSFAIVMFHMLTGQLPFDGAMPLAFKQMQFQQELPYVDELNPELPQYFTEILRRGTSQDPDQRPKNLTAIVEELHQVIDESTGLGLSFVAAPDDETEEDTYGDLTLTGTDFNATDTAILEAVDIYSRARHNWAGGNGRFLLGVTHFMLMNGYYMAADSNGLELDEYGMQMLLRGALEYDHEVNYWWARLNDDNRRWVCLHALRSGNAPARVRALNRLETLPDADTPQIPRLVGQALQVETNEEARIAALQVLGTRAKFFDPERNEYDIDTQLRGRMITSLTRLGVQVSSPGEWRQTVYTPEIDTLIAETALDYGTPRVAEFAARIVGRMRSRLAVEYIAEQQREGRRGALRALALVRDEAPSLPSVVSGQGRFYAWSANTLRRLTEHPMGLVFRYVIALIGAWLGMGYHVFSVYRSQGIFLQQRWANTVAIGLIFGLLTGVVVITAGEFTDRVRGFWPRWIRALVALTVGTIVGAFAWWSWIWFYLQLDPAVETIIFGGFFMALGYVLTSIFRLRSWVAVPITAMSIYFPVFVSFWIGWYLWSGGDWPYATFDGISLDLFLENTPYRWFALLLLAFGVALGGIWLDFLGRRLRQLTVGIPAVLVFLVISFAPLWGAFALGWMQPSTEVRPLNDLWDIEIVLQEPPHWQLMEVQPLANLSDLNAAVWPGDIYRPFDHLLRFDERGEALLYYQAFDENFMPELSPQIFTVAIPFALLLALGGHFPSILRDLRALVRWLMGGATTELLPTLDYAVDTVGDADATDAMGKRVDVPGLDPNTLETELDMNQGNQEGGGFRQETEIDYAQGLHGEEEIDRQAAQLMHTRTFDDDDELADWDQPTEPSRSTSELEHDGMTTRPFEKNPPPSTEQQSELVNRGTGIHIGPPTESPDTMPIPESKSQVVNQGTGIKITPPETHDPLEPPTDIESKRVDKGTGIKITDEDAEDEEPPKSKSQVVNQGTGIKITPPETRDPLDPPTDMKSKRVDKGTGIKITDEDAEDEEPPKSKSQVVNFGTGIKITPPPAEPPPGGDTKIINRGSTDSDPPDEDGEKS